MSMSSFASATNPLPQPSKDPLDQFDPNINKLPWATYAPGRRPEWKTHSSRGTALNAFNNNRSWSGCILYKLENGKWVEAARFSGRDFMPKSCSGCGMSVLVYEEKWDYGTRPAQRVKTGRRVVSATQVLERRHGSRKIAEPLNVLTLCMGCKQGMGY